MVEFLGIKTWGCEITFPSMQYAFFEWWPLSDSQPSSRQKIILSEEESTCQKNGIKVAWQSISTPKRPALSTSPTSVCLSSHGSSSHAHGESSETDNSSIGEPLVSDYSVHELPVMSSVKDSDNVVLNAGLLARVEYLEAELKEVKLSAVSHSFFRVEDISSYDELIRFYTGFPSYKVFLAAFDFLGPAVKYLGTSRRTVRKERHKWKFNPKNHFFLTLVRLRLNPLTITGYYSRPLGLTFSKNHKQCYCGVLCVHG